jgi:hypothetical protein
MRALFDYGYQKAIHGYRWHKAPPILAQPEGRQSGIQPGLLGLWPVWE